MLVETRVGRLFVESVGEGPDVVFWHSLLCDGGMWRKVIELLAGSYRCINVDAPGHGRSSPMRRGFSMDECVDASVELLDALKLAQPSWVGLSWGGMVGMRLAARHPDRVRALGLFDTSAREEKRREKLFQYRALSLAEAVIGPAPFIARAAVPSFFSPLTVRERPWIVDDFVSKLVRMDAQSVGFAVDTVLFRRGDVTDELKKIRARTLVAIGEHDVATPMEETEHLVAHVPNAVRATIPRAGHLSALEQPAIVADALRSIL